MITVRDCQEVIPKIAMDETTGKPCLFRQYMPLKPRRAPNGTKPITYAPCQADLEEKIRLLAVHNASEPSLAMRAINEEMERHARMPKRP